MEEFDLLFYKGDGLISRAIKKVTKSEYSHVALVLDNYHLLETNWSYPLSVRHISYKSDEYDLYRVQGLTDHQKDMIRKYIKDTILTDYDTKLTLSFIPFIRFIFGIMNNRNKFNCSEWIDLAFLNAGVDLLPNKEFSTITPAELSKSPRILATSPRIMKVK